MARELNGTNQYLTNGSAIVPAVPMTMAAWVRAASIASAQCVIGMGNSLSNASLITLYIRGDISGNPIRAHYRNESFSQREVDTTIGVSANTWHHACAVFSETTASAFIDGGSKGTIGGDVSPAPVVDLTGVGILNRAAPASPLHGRIAFPCIWDVALTDAEVLSLARGTHPSLVRPQSIVALWELTGGSSPEPDRFGGLGLTLVNAPTVTDNPRILLPRRNRTFVSPIAAPPSGTSFWRTRQANQASTVGVIG